MRPHRELLADIQEIIETAGICIAGDVRIDASLEQLGINSIDSIRIISEIERKYRCRVDLAEALKESNPTIASLFANLLADNNLTELIAKYDKCVDRQVIQADGVSLNYLAFFERVRVVADYFIKYIPMHAVIVIDENKSINTVINVFACIMSNNGYCILDRDSPVERRFNLIKKLDPALIISDRDYSDLCIDTCPSEKMQDYRFKYDLNDKLRYAGNIIFTSGSTGEPKGVKLSFTALASYVDSMLDIMPQRHGRWLSISPLHFDVYQLDFLLQFARGMDVILAPEKPLPQQIVHLLNTYEIDETIFISTMMKMVCSVYSNEESICNSLSKLYYGAESCPVATLKEAKRLFPNIQFCQFYGPTENTNNSTFYEFLYPRETDTGFMPIGESIKNTQIQLIDDSGRKIVESGMVGEITLSGSQLMDGYLDLLEHEKGEVPRQLKKYMTGDYGYFDEDHVLWFTGRKDDLVKLRGNRIALQEVEVAMASSFAGVDQAIPFINNKDGFDRLYLAYVGKSIDPESVKLALASKLPKFAVPDYIFHFQRCDVKYLSTGKIDKKHIVSKVINSFKAGELA